MSQAGWPAAGIASLRVGDDMTAIEEPPLNLVGVPSCPVCDATGAFVEHGGLTDRLFGAPGRWTFRRCGACRTMFLDPQPAYKDIPLTYTAAYAGRKGNRWAAPAGWLRRMRVAIGRGFTANSYSYNDNVTVWQKALALPFLLSARWRENFALEIMRLPAGQRGGLLDIGCGVGEFLETMRAHGWDVEGIDLDPKVLETCRLRGLRVREGTLEEQRYAEGQFDAVSMRHVLEHVPEPVRLLRECRRILRPGGVLVVLTPNADSLGHRVFGRDWLGLDVSRHLTVFSLGALRLAAERAGFTVESCRSGARISRWVFRASSMLARTGQNAYESRAGVADRIREIAFEKWLRISGLWDPNAGDELFIMARK